MQTFLSRLSSYIGEGTGGDLAITKVMVDDWLTQGAKDIITQLPTSLLHNVSTDTTITTSSGTPITTNKILYVTRSDGDKEYPCRKEHSVNLNQLDNINSIKYSCPHDPAYVVDNGNVKIKPDPSSTYIGRVTHVQFPSVSATSSDISSFPDELDNLVFVYSVAQAKMREAGYVRRKAWDEYDSVVTLLSSFESAIPGTAGIDAITLGTDYSGITDALTKAQETIDTTASINFETQIGNDELELARAAVEAANGEVARAGAEIQKVQMKVNEFVNNVGVENTKLAIKIQRANSYLSESSVRLKTYSGFIGQLQIIDAEVVNLVKKYETDLQNYIKLNG